MKEKQFIAHSVPDIFLMVSRYCRLKLR